jgi:hypothetical protein
MGSSTLLPVSASTTVDRAMDGAASSMTWSHSSAVMKLWYSQARGLQDKCSILYKHREYPQDCAAGRHAASGITMPPTALFP